ncbi:MAG: hypothetical protein ACXW3C_05275 [Pyrinomonadaceae bacterium]
MAILQKQQLPFLILAMSVLLMTAQAQSGRRKTGGSTTTTTTTPSVDGPKTVEKKPAVEPQVQLRVGMDRTGAYTPTPFYVYDAVLDVCIRRLSQAEIVFAAAVGTNLTRSQAVKMAKEETTRWIVVLEVRSFYTDSGRQVQPEQDELYVSYTVIEPVTGKTKRSGRTRQHIYQGKQGPISLPTRNGTYSEYSIRQAGGEAADQILAGFDIKVRE